MKDETETETETERTATAREQRQRRHPPIRPKPLPKKETLSPLLSVPLQRSRVDRLKSRSRSVRIVVDLLSVNSDP